VIPPRVATRSPARGYAHADYASALADFGSPRWLSACGGWVLERPIRADSAAHDAMGCYPLFCCADWNGLPDDLERLERDLVSLVLVTDPMADLPPAWLARCFGDLARPFKEHYVADLSQAAEQFVDAHHRRNARQALGNVNIEVTESPYLWAAEWTSLYQQLIAHHSITGLPAFSTTSLTAQLKVPGAIAVRARHGDATVAMLVWYVDDDVAYYHLGASSPEGYARKASFGLFWESLAYFADRGIAWLELGSGAGTVASNDDGLSRFKRGWSTGTRTAYLCGRIFDPGAYAALTADSGVESGKYFPAYRTGEFT
jgi:Acetyltransferase (GNAT) domain